MTLERWTRVAEWPLIAASLVFLTAYSVEVVANLTESQSEWLEAVVWTTWAVFAVDYVAKLALAPARGRWFVRNIHELAILALPVLRPLRLLRLVLMLRVVHRTPVNRLRGLVVVYAVGSAVVLTYCGALAVLDAEQNADGANITGFGEAIWWALATITTVGYGDHYPVTAVGRAVAAALMVSGIAVLGVVTASVASWLVEAVGRETAAAVGAADGAVEARIAALTAQVARLEAELASARSGRRTGRDSGDGHRALRRRCAGRR